MWQIPRSNFRLFAFLLLIITFSLTIIFLNRSLTLAQESPKHRNMYELLEALKVKMIAEPGFEIIFKFSEPLMDNDEYNWTIPFSPQGDDIYRTIGEIGDDFICFAERAGSSLVERCTPFSNIVRIGYLDD